LANDFVRQRQIVVAHASIGGPFRCFLAVYRPLQELAAEW
jgi:hypothetical protein